MQFGVENILEKTQGTIALNVLTENYHRMLVTKAGLAKDPDTLYFLEGRILPGSTYTSYEAHVSPEAIERLYRVLKPVSVEKPLRTNVRRNEAFISKPKTNHEVAQVTGKITIKPGERITILTPSGVTGRLNMTYSHSKIS